MPNIKVYITWSTLYCISLFLVTKSYAKMLLYGGIILQSFTVGQLYSVKIIDASLLITQFYPEGRSLFFTVTPIFILQISAIFYFILILIKNKFKVKFTISTVIILGIVFIGLLSAINSRYLPTLSVIYSLQSLGKVAWLLCCIHLIRGYNLPSRKKILTILAYLLCLVILFETSIVLLQFIKRSAIGLKIEQTQTLPSWGEGADENPLQFRPIGLRNHANILSNAFQELLFGLLIVTSSLGISRAKSSIYYNVVIALSIVCTFITIIVAQSRSIYIALTFVGAVLLFKSRNQIRRLIINNKSIFYRYKITIFLLLIPIGYIILDRVINTFNSFSDTGGVVTRKFLAFESLMLIERFPILGIGSGMFIPAAFEQNFTSVMKYFPEAVHDGFLLLTTENGIFTLFLFLVFIFFISRSIFYANLGSKTKFFALSGLFSQLVVMFFQPFTNILTLNVMLTLILLR